MAKAKQELSDLDEKQEATPEAALVEKATEEKDKVSTKDSVAKAGKRSAKALKAVEEKVAKEERKVAHATDEEAAKPKITARPARSRLERRGKKFREAAKRIEREKSYPLSEALELATKTSPTKFDASVELHVNLNVDPRHADQNVRDSLVLPSGTGKAVRVAVFAEAEAADAQKAGADIVGAEKVLQHLEKNQLPFDVLIATPSQMPKLGKYARILGPRGLMPNPKSGTVTGDVVKAVKEAKAGRVEYRVDSTGIVHLSIGKVSFGKAKLEENARAVLGSIKGNKPASVKGGYIKAAHIATTMGPSITFDPNEQL